MTHSFTGEQLGFPELGRVLADLNVAAETVGARFMLVGALARDLWLYHSTGGRPPIATRDVDFGVEVATDAHYEAFKLALGGWAQQPNEHELRAPGGTKVDVVPFGDIESPTGSVLFRKGEFEMNVLGYREALDEAGDVLIDGVRVRLLPLRAYGPLKVLAWRDRGTRDPKDAQDVGRLLDGYFLLETDRITTHHLDLFDADAFDPRTAGARAYGRDAAGFLNRNATLKAAVLAVLDREHDEDSAFVRAMGDVAVREPAVRAAMLAAFVEGVRDAR